MNRRNFLGAAIAAALVPLALIEKPQPMVFGADFAVGGIDRSTFTWWRNRDHISFQGAEIVWDDERAMIDKMAKLWRECVANTPQPSLIVIDERLHKVLKSQGYLR